MKRTFQLLGICLALFIGYFMYSLMTGQERVTALCSQIKPGTTIEELRQLADNNGFNPPSSLLDSKSPRTYLAESRSMGRHVCAVELENGAVKATRYQSNP